MGIIIGTLIATVINIFGGAMFIGAIRQALPPEPPREEQIVIREESKIFVPPPDEVRSNKLPPAEER